MSGGGCHFRQRSVELNESYLALIPIKLKRSKMAYNSQSLMEF